MPVYQYQDKQGRVTELLRPVALRDVGLPAGLKRITVPRRLAIAGTSSDAIDPETAEAQVPKAYRHLEGKMSAREVVKESGYTPSEIRQIWNF